MPLEVRGAFLADCPTRLAIEILSDKWSVVTLFALMDGPRRHGGMVDLIGDVSRKVLTQTLRRLQGYGLVDREVFNEAPPRVQYSLTDLGTTLRQPIQALTTWAREHGESIAEPTRSDESAAS